MLLALSSAQKAGLAGMAAAFIIFALIVSIAIPHYRPSFPTKALGVFFGLVALFTVAMLLTVVFVAKEAGEEEASATPEPTATSGEGTRPPPPTETAAPPPAGDAAAGKAIFARAGCVGCHTLAAAGSTGTVGPNLDEAKPDVALIVERVTNGKLPMPSFKGQLSPRQIQDVAAFVFESTHGGT